jgi:hypothetical protein
MVGHGSLAHLDLLVQQQQCAQQQQHNHTTTCPCDRNPYRSALWNGTAYRERADVFIKFNQAVGPLTIGHDYAAPTQFGPELMFGWTLGDYFQQPQQEQEQPQLVYLIKTAWGGKDLAYVHG